jgi:threonine dehydrogenase-like Zn-dependent dehydrogenase
VAGLEATYVSTQQTPLKDLANKVGKADLVVDATGNSNVAFGAMEVLGHNGVLVWTSITGGREHIEQLPSDKINLDWVLGNKLLVGSVNANREHFEMGIKDLAMGEVMYPGVIQKILTNPVQGLDGYKEMMRLLVEERTALKVYVEVAAG